MNLTRSRILTFVELINDILDESTQLTGVVSFVQGGKQVIAVVHPTSKFPSCSDGKSFPWRR